MASSFARQAYSGRPGEYDATQQTYDEGFKKAMKLVDDIVSECAPQGYYERFNENLLHRRLKEIWEDFAG